LLERQLVVTHFIASSGSEAMLRQLLVNFWKEESGTELLEYALLVGLIVIGAMGLMSAMGVKVLGKWQSLDDSY
jgi:Flp pilus assembly pilin Flp